MKNYRISAEQKMKLQKDIQDWKNQHNQIMLVSLEDDPFDCICKVPSTDHLKLANSNKNDMDKNKQLVLSCILYPDRDIFLKIIEEERKEGIIIPLATKLVEASGATQQATMEKL